MRASRCDLSQEMKIERMLTCHRKELAKQLMWEAAKTASVHVQPAKESLVGSPHGSRTLHVCDCDLDLVEISMCKIRATRIKTILRLIGGLSVSPSAILLDGRLTWLSFAGGA